MTNGFLSKTHSLTKPYNCYSHGDVILGMIGGMVNVLKVRKNLTRRSVVYTMEMLAVPFRGFFPGDNDELF